MSRRHDVVVIGAGGSQAQAMLLGASRGADLSGWLAVDRLWRPEAEAATRALGPGTATLDVLDEPGPLRDLLSSARLVVNLAGPYYRTGAVVLDAAIESGTDYLDICDDADVTIPMLDRAAAAERAGIRALIGMGSSPGTTNVLIRAAVDALGEAGDVDISWTVDIGDMTDAAVRHFWHCFTLVAPDGSVTPVAGWSGIDRRTVEFPGTVGRQEVLRLAHPEPITVPRFLPVARSSNFGAITPADALLIAWGLAYSVDPGRPEGRPDLPATTDAAVQVFSRYRDSRPPAPRIGSGLQIDVHTDGEGLRFSSGGETEMAEATGVPAAAGTLLMLDGLTPEAGVFAPELLRPADFFTALRRVSRGGGGLELHRLRNGRSAERVRIRDLVAGQLDQVGAR